MQEWMTRGPGRYALVGLGGVLGGCLLAFLVLSRPAHIPFPPPYPVNLHLLCRGMVVTEATEFQRLPEWDADAPVLAPGQMVCAGQGPNPWARTVLLDGSAQVGYVQKGDLSPFVPAPAPPAP